MLGGAAARAVAHGVSRIPGLKALPVLELLAIGEIALVVRSHVAKLEPAERRRLVELLRAGRGRPRNLSAGDREELAGLVAKAEPRLFAGSVASKLSPFPLPRRVIEGRKRRAN